MRLSSGEHDDKRIDEPHGSLERKRFGDGDALGKGDSARLPGGTGTPYSSLKSTLALESRAAKGKSSGSNEPAPFLGEDGFRSCDGEPPPPRYSAASVSGSSSQPCLSR